jgi:biotin carboxyl carrier protein
MFKAQVNKKSFEVQNSEDGFLIDGKLFQWDIQQIGEGNFHILHNSKSFSAEVVKVDRATKTCIVKVNGKLVTVEVRDRFDLLLEKMGMTAAASSKVNNVKAPMPGLIIDLKVKPGDAVQQGETLLVLEAMKMENIIKSPGAGTVKSVKVEKGQSVEKNQVLIEF